VRSFVAASEPMAPALGETLGRGADDLLDGTRPVPLEEHLDDQTEEQVIPLGKDPGALRGEPIEEGRPTRSRGDPLPAGDQPESLKRLQMLPHCGRADPQGLGQGDRAELLSNQ